MMPRVVVSRGSESRRALVAVLAVTLAVVMMAMVWRAQTAPSEHSGVSAAAPPEVTVTAAPLAVAIGGGVEVHAGDQARAETLLAEGRRAWRTVHRVLPGPGPALVLELPRSQADLEADLAVPSGSYAGIAAVTTTTGGRPRVYLNPAVFSGLSPLGRRVVLAHEATHVAVGATSTEVPGWMREGFADYVALRDVDVPVHRSARHLLARQDRPGAPAARLPDEAEFATAGDRLAAAYEAAWTACLLIVATDGEAALVRLYDAVASGEPLARALPATTSFDRRTLTSRWRRSLADLR